MDMHHVIILTGQLIESEEPDPPEGALVYTAEDWESPITVALIPGEAPIPDGWQLSEVHAGYVLGDMDPIYRFDEGGAEVPVVRAIVLQTDKDLGVPEGQVLVAVVPQFGGAT